MHGSGWYAQHSIDPEAELEDVELLGATDLPRKRGQAEDIGTTPMKQPLKIKQQTQFVGYFLTFYNTL